MGYPSLDAAKAEALAFCQFPPRTARFVTRTRSGVLRGRSVTAGIRPDWTVEILTPKEYRRTDQVRANPEVMLIWDDAPSTDFGAPTRVVYASGRCTVLEGPEVERWFERARHENPRIANRTPEYAAAAWYVLRVEIGQVRMEGFAAPGERLEYRDVEAGLQFGIGPADRGEER